MLHRWLLEQYWHKILMAGASHSLMADEQRSAYNRELQAIVWAVCHFRHYLSLCPFTIVTDHQLLLSLHQLPIDNDKTGCSRALELNPYDWVIVHKRGSQHTNADSLSRRPDLTAELMDSDAP